MLQTDSGNLSVRLNGGTTMWHHPRHEMLRCECWTADMAVCEVVPEQIYVQGCRDWLQHNNTLTLDASFFPPIAAALFLTPPLPQHRPGKRFASQLADNNEAMAVWRFRRVYRRVLVRLLSFLFLQVWLSPADALMMVEVVQKLH